MAKIAILSIGTELLIGQVINTNAAWMGEQLNALGLVVTEQICIADEADILKETILRLSEKYDVILMTGGLGPTRDDITKKIMAELLHCDLTTYDVQAEKIKEFFIKSGRTASPQALVQALIPSAAEGFLNLAGAAPLMKMSLNQAVIYSMPGVPSEMKFLMNTYVLPQLQTYFISDYIENRTLMFAGITESNLSVLLEKIEDQTPKGVSLAYLPNIKSIRLRVSLQCPHAEKEKYLVEYERFYHSIIETGGVFCYAKENTNLETVVGQLLLEKNQTVSFAESCSGGLLCGRVLSVSGASKYVEGGVVAYSNQVKMNELDVDESTILTFGAVSEPTVEAMAKGARKKFKTNYGLALSGIAGPLGATSEKPVGTICWSIATENQSFTGTFHFADAGRDLNIERSIIGILDKFRRILLGYEL